MRNTILFIIFLIFSFIINICFYYLSDDYRNFLKNIKNDKYSSLDLNNSFIDTINKEISSDEFTDNQINDDFEIVKKNNENNAIFNKLENNKVEIKNSITLWKNYKKILDIFNSNSLQELELNTNLFDITDEYPDNYLEYYSKNLTLYFFPTKNYSEVYDIFSILSSELPFKINETNSFWDNSFFINLNQDINDSFIRMVVSHNWVVFWLKIKKNEYNIVKENLNILRTNQ